MNDIPNDLISPNFSGAELKMEAQVVAPCAKSKKLHRVASVRGEQGVSLRSASRRLGCTIAAVKAMEDETRDLCISDLIRWREVLEVPLQDLLVEPDASLSNPIRERAQLLRVMKTAASLKATVTTQSGERLVSQLMRQLIDIMPELEEVLAWNLVGQRRTPDEYGRAAERILSDELLRS